MASRNRRCFVPGCTSGYTNNPEKVSLFKAPKDANLRETWARTIDREDRILRESDVICAKHFEDGEIIRSLDMGFQTFPLQKPRLQVNAVPTLFPKILSSRRKRRTKIKAIRTVKRERQPSIAEPVILDTEKIFKSILSSRDLNLDEHWGIFKDQNYLLLSQLEIKDGNPVTIKQVHLTRECEVFYYAGSIRIPVIDLASNITTKKEFVEEVNKFSCITLCQGSLSSDVTFSSEDCLTCITSTAYIDYSQNVWRHNDCEFICDTDGYTCSECSDLQKFYEFEMNSLQNIINK